jgi:hypothetical protein
MSANPDRRRRAGAAPMAALVMAALLAGLPVAARAQTCQRLDGLWALQPDKGRLGSGLSFNPYYAISGVQLGIETDGQRMRQQWRFSGPHLQRETRYTFTIDGTRRDTGVADPMDFEYVAMAAEWQNCTLVQTGYSRLFGMEVVTTSTYVVAPDGRELTIVQYGESPVSVVDRRLVLRKVD